MPWGQVVNLRGPEGPQGAQGPEGPPGVQGPPGEDGAVGVTIAGSVPTYADLPTNLTEDDIGAGYLVEADGDLYVWSGTSFPPDGSGTDFRGPQGPAGPAGPQGETGATGQRGSRWFTGSGAPTTVPGSFVGDLYLDTSDGTVYELI